MKKIAFVLFVSVIGFIACQNKKPATGKETTDQKSEVVANDPAKDSAEIRTVITDFYNWYGKNYSKLQEYKLYSSIKKKEAPPYKINWEEVEKYQQFIRDSVSQLGQEFLQNQKHFFEQCDSAFKVDVEDDIPYGFDYDWYTYSQEETQYLVDQINKAKSWPITRADDYATVEVKGDYDNNGKQMEGTFITITMKKENGKWKIAKIGND